MAQIPAGYRALEASQRKPRAGAKRTGNANPNEILTVSVRVRRRTDAPALPDAMNLAATPHGNKQYLSREDFAAHYGASQADLDKIAEFAKEQGLEVVESSIPRRTVVLKGTAAQMSKAFAVEMGMYETSTEKYRGRDGQVHVPDAISGIVEGVFGLDNRQMAKPHIRGGKGPATVTEGTPAQATVPLTPPQVAQLYGFPTSPNASGQTIGIFEFGGGYKLSDVQLFYNSIHATVPSITAVSVDGQTNNPGTDGYTTETLLDIGVSGSVAPGAKLAVYFAPWTEQGWVDIVTTAIHDATNKPSVISISYGWPENDTFGSLTWSAAAIKAVTETFQEAAALGVTIMVSSGDNGSSCGESGGKAHVEYPGSDPNVTCCGGTTISNVNGLNFTQDVWNDNGVTGGGISDIFVPPAYPLPIWQNWASIPGSVNDGHKGRGIPDIAGNADQQSGYTLFQNGQNIGAVGGTSAVAPLYAGLTALMNAGLGEPVGYLNPNLYAVPYSYVYRDINDGQSNASGGAPGYKSGPGWDACTGLGSVNGAALQNALRGVGLPVAIETYDSKLYMVWKGEERDDRVFMSTFNGTAWSPQQLIPGIGSSTGVALAAYGGKLYMAWKGVLGDQGIYYSAYNGTSWTPQQLVAGIGSSVGPRLAVIGNNLFMAWKGVENDQRIFFNQFNGSSWTAQQFVPSVATSVGPAVVNFNNAIYMVWKGENGDQGLYWSKFNGSSFAPQQLIAGVASSEGPSLAVFGNALYAVWKGEFGDQTMWYSSFNGSAWTAQKQIAGIFSSVGPGLAVFDNALYACWKGELGDQRIWYSHFNGSTWAAQQLTSAGGTSPDLVMTAGGSGS
jgi:subtilase family serine protease